MLYAIISQDVEDSGPLRAKARPAHINRLEELFMGMVQKNKNKDEK